MCCSQQSAAIWQSDDIIYLPPAAAAHTVQSVSVANSGVPSESEAATGCSSCLHRCCWRTWNVRLRPVEAKSDFHLIQQKEHQQQHAALLIWMCKTRQSGSATKQIRYGFKALQVMRCLLTFILCYYHSSSLRVETITHLALKHSDRHNTWEFWPSLFW